MKQRIKNLGKLILLTSILVTGCSSDFHTKKKAKEELKRNTIEVVNNYFDLNYVENHSSAFGLLKQIDKRIRLPMILSLQGVVSLLGLCVLWKIKNRNLGLLVALTVLLSGAFGNFVDRLFNGFVTDFLHLHYFDKYSFPVFNIADILITIGVILLIFQVKNLEIALRSIISKK